MLNFNYTLRKTTFKVLLFLTIISCSDNGLVPESVKPVSDDGAKKSVAARISKVVFDGSEGDIISLDTAKRWIDSYIARENRVVSIFFSKRALDMMMAYETSVGIRFYYIESEEGQQNMFAKATNEFGNDLENSTFLVGRFSSSSLDEQNLTVPVSGTELDSVSSDEFNRQIQNYSDKRPNEVRAHFFGYDIIRMLLSYNDCVGLRCYYALDKNTSEAKIILVGVKGSGANLLPNCNSSGRTTEDGPFLADFSYPCPTLCSGN